MKIIKKKHTNALTSRGSGEALLNSLLSGSYQPFIIFFIYSLHYLFKFSIMYIISKSIQRLITCFGFMLLGSASFIAASLDKDDRQLYQTILASTRSVDANYEALAKLIYNARNIQQYRNQILQKLEEFHKANFSKINLDKEKEGKFFLQAVVDHFKKNPLKEDEKEPDLTPFFTKLLTIIDTSKQPEAIIDLLELAIFRFGSEKLVTTIVDNLNSNDHVSLDKKKFARRKKIDKYLSKILDKKFEEQFKEGTEQDQEKIALLNSIQEKLYGVAINKDILLLLAHYKKNNKLYGAEKGKYEQEHKKNEQLETKNTELKSENEKLENEKTALGNEKTALENGKIALANELNLEKNNVQELKNKLKEYEENPDNTITTLKNEIKNLKIEKENAVKAKEELDTKVTDLTKDRDKYKTEAENIKKNMPQDKKTLLDRIKKLEGEKQKLEKDKKELIDTKKDSSSSDPNNSTLSKENQKLNKRIKIRNIVIFIGALSIFVSMIIHVMNIPKVQEMIQNIIKKGKKDSGAKEDDDEIDQMTEY